ncbi:hypothetical protein [Natrinema salinisoli]|uniref:hypothetical protein n=1 Tax=Natrinema salinisoli TaxID=2878535 RepID=UPI001CF07474|nr:hypothetical protein [Natrinema salinisoli]
MVDIIRSSSLESGIGYALVRLAAATDDARVTDAARDVLGPASAPHRRHVFIDQ